MHYTGYGFTRFTRVVRSQSTRQRLLRGKVLFNNNNKQLKSQYVGSYLPNVCGKTNFPLKLGKVFFRALLLLLPFCFIIKLFIHILC
jgi:hypothetical protein